MDYQTFLKKIVEQMPSNVFDSFVYINEMDEEAEECISYKIVGISNEGNNDTLHIYITKD